MGHRRYFGRLKSRLSKPVVARYAPTMNAKHSGKLVYSTERGVGTCPRCGWPASECRCSVRSEERVPERIVARLRIEKSGRKGKTVTVVAGLPRNKELLADLSRELKRLCGSGGSFREDRVEIQGEQRNKVREHLTAKGWTVKG